MTDKSLNESDDIERVNNALANLRTDPLPSLKYLYDVALNNEQVLEECEANEQIIADMLNTLRLPVEPGAKSEDGEESIPEDPGSYTESILVSSLVSASKWKTSFISNGAIPELLEDLFSAGSKEETRRNRIASILYVLREESSLEEELRKKIDNESPFVAARPLPALLFEGLLNQVVNAGAVECLGRALQSLETARAEDIINVTKSLGTISFQVPDIMDEEKPNEDEDTAFTRKLKGLYETHITTPSNIAPILASWISLVHIEASASLAELLSKITLHMEDGDTRVTEQISQHLQGISRRSNNIHPVTIALFTLISHRNIHSQLSQKLVTSVPTIVDILVDTLDPACGPIGQEPYLIEHAAAHALASCIYLGDEATSLVHTALTKQDRFKSIMDTLVLIAEFNPLGSQLTHINADTDAVPALYQSIVTNWSELQDYIYDEYFPQQFDPELNPNPKYGAGILLHVITSIDSRDKLIEAGIVYYLYRIARNTTVGEDIWESAVNSASWLADEDNAVDLFGDSRLEELGTANMLRIALLDPPSDPALAHRAQKEAAYIIPKLVKHVPEDSQVLVELHKRGFLDALFAVIRSGSKPSFETRANAVRAMAAILESEPAREETIKQDDILSRLVEVALGWNAQEREKAESDGLFEYVQVGMQAAHVALRHLNRDSTHTPILSNIIQTKLSSITEIADKLKVVPCLSDALSDSGAAYTAHSAWIGGGVIPLLFSIIQAERTDDLGIAEKLDAADVLLEHVANQSWHDYAYKLLLDTEPGIIAISGGLLKDCDDDIHGSRDILVKASALLTLTGVAQWSQDGTSLGTRTMIVQYEDGYIPKAVAEILVMDASTAERGSHYAIVERKTIMERTKRAALEFIDKLTNDEESFAEVKKALVDGGIMEALKDISSQGSVRIQVKMLLRRLKRDELVLAEDDDEDDEESGEFDVERFKALCKVVMRPSKSVEKRSDAVRELADIVSSSDAEEEFIKRPDVIKVLVEALFGLGSLKIQLEEDEDEDELREDDPRGAAAQLFESMTVGCGSDSQILEKFISTMKRVFQGAKSRNERCLLLKSTKLVLNRTSNSSLHRPMMDAGLVDLISALLRDAKLDLAQLTEVALTVESILSSSCDSESSKQFLDSGILEILVKLISTSDVPSSGEENSEAKMRRLLGFHLVISLANNVENRLQILRFDGVTESAVREVGLLAKPLVLPPEGIDDWSKGYAIAMYHLTPLNLLDILSCRKASFQEAKERYAKANLDQALNQILTSGRGEDSWGVISSMNQTAKELLERMAKDDLEDEDEEFDTPDAEEDSETKMNRLIQTLTSPIEEEPPYTSLHQTAYDLETMARLDDADGKQIIKSVKEPDVKIS